MLPLSKYPRATFDAQESMEMANWQVFKTDEDAGLGIGSVLTLPIRHEGIGMYFSLSDYMVGSSLNFLITRTLQQSEVRETCSASQEVGEVEKCEVEKLITCYP